MWDITHEDSLSKAFARNKLLATIIWTYITLHLLELIPARYDPLRAYRKEARR